jgi:hypothetical protein
MGTVVVDEDDSQMLCTSLYYRRLRLHTRLSGPTDEKWNVAGHRLPAWL